MPLRAHWRAPRRTPMKFRSASMPSKHPVAGFYISTADGDTKHAILDGDVCPWSYYLTGVPRCTQYRTPYGA